LPGWPGAANQRWLRKSETEILFLSVIGIYSN